MGRFSRFSSRDSPCESSGLGVQGELQAIRKGCVYGVPETGGAGHGNADGEELRSVGSSGQGPLLSLTFTLKDKGSY